VYFLFRALESSLFLKENNKKSLRVTAFYRGFIKSKEKVLNAAKDHSQGILPLAKYL